MWELILVRHAIAEDPPADGSLPDAERALTPEGHKRMCKAASGLAGQVAAVDLLVSSPLRRARQTADILAKKGPEPDERDLHEGLAPGGDPETFLAWLAGRPGGRVLAVGHEPDLSRLATLALAGDAPPVLHFKKGGALGIRFAAPPAPANGLLQWYLPPRILRALGRT